MVIKPIASGSAGNAYWITDSITSLLLDAGVPLRQIQRGCGYKAALLAGCLVTHAHGDHIRAAKDLAKLGVDIFTSRGSIDHAGLTGHRIHAVKATEMFETGSWRILPFDVEHDAPEPLGFLLQSKKTGEKLLYFTDTSYLRYRFQGLTHIMMEANYDPEEMEKNVLNGRVNIARAKRTYRSHMSIETAITTLQGLDLARLQQIWLLHLSNDNARAEEFRRRVQELTGKEVYVC